MRLTDNIQALVDAAMRERGLSMNALAKEIGINQPTLLRIYNGESRDPRRDAINKIARYFRLASADDLYNANLSGLPDGLLPSTNSIDIDGQVKSSHAHLPMKPGVTEVDQAVTAVLSMLGWSLDEYLSADRSAVEPRKPRSPYPVRRHTERTSGVPVSTVVESKKG